MSDAKGGMGAEVGVRKINSEGQVEQEEGVADSGASRLAWFIFMLMLTLSSFGLWKIVELIPL